MSKKKIKDVRLVGEKGDFATITVERERNIYNEHRDLGWENPKVVRAQALGMAVNQHSFASDTQKTIAAAEQFAAFITDGTVPEVEVTEPISEERR